MSFNRPIPAELAPPNSEAERYLIDLTAATATTDGFDGGDGVSLNNVSGVLTFAVDLTAATPLTFDAQGALDFQIASGGPLTVSSGELTFSPASMPNALAYGAFGTANATYDDAEMQDVFDALTELKSTVNGLRAALITAGIGN